MPELTYTETLVTEVCWCGINHAIPVNLARQAKENGTEVYCPLGHKWVVRETTVKKLERELAEERRVREAAEKRARATRELLAHEERSHAATRGHLTRTKKRIGNGVCPCCNRHFTNLERHMHTKHPDYVSEPAAS